MPRRGGVGGAAARVQGRVKFTNSESLLLDAAVARVAHGAIRKSYPVTQLAALARRYENAAA